MLCKRGTPSYLGRASWEIDLLELREARREPRLEGEVGIKWAKNQEALTSEEKHLGRGSCICKHSGALREGQSG